LVNDFVPTLSVKRPFAYLYPASMTRVTELLLRHGVEVEELREDIEMDLEAYKVEAMTRARAFQKHELADINASIESQPERAPAGSMLARTAQKLAALPASLLEPRSADGLTAWNFFDESLSIGNDFPVKRVPAPVPMLTCPTRPLAEDREMNKPIT